MQAYLGGQSVTADIPLIDSDGDQINATAASYRVIDQAETVLVASTPVTGFSAGDSNAVVTVAGEDNTLAEGATRELRIIELILTTDEGTVKLSHEYFIEGEQLLTEGVNSFQNYATALLTAYDIPNLPGWESAEKPARITALMQARHDMGKVRFRYDHDSMDTIVLPGFGVTNITDLSPDEYANLPSDFKRALRRAQIMQADSILGGDVSDEIRRAGIVSKRVGESSESYKARRPISLPIHRRALEELAKYLVQRVRVGRVGGPSASGNDLGLW